MFLRQRKITLDRGYCSIVVYILLVNTMNSFKLLNSLRNFGADETNRTSDLLITNQLLYQLSYISNGRYCSKKYKLSRILQLVSESSISRNINFISRFPWSLSHLTRYLSVYVLVLNLHPKNQLLPKHLSTNRSMLETRLWSHLQVSEIHAVHHW